MSEHDFFKSLVGKNISFVLRSNNKFYFGRVLQTRNGEVQVLIDGSKTPWVDRKRSELWGTFRCFCDVFVWGDLS